MVPGRSAVFLLGLLLASPLFAQTPSPLADWQYSTGEVLRSLGDQPIPDWRETVGLGVSTQPSFVGAKGLKVLPSVVMDVRYKDIAFASDGEGIGVNLLRGPGYRAGISLSYDLGATAMTTTICAICLISPSRRRPRPSLRSLSSPSCWPSISAARSAAMTG